MDVSIKRYPFVNDIVYSFEFLSLRGGNDTSQGMDYGVAGLGCYMFNQLGMLYPKKFRENFRLSNNRPGSVHAEA